jgi:hypothetical protein
MNEVHLVLHGVAIKKHGSAQAIASLLGLDPERVGVVLQDLLRRGRVSELQGRFSLSPASRMALASEYSRHYGTLRSNQDVVAAYDTFERINVELKTLISQWQTLEVAGEIVQNNHTDLEYDRGIIDRLGRVHERADRVLGVLAAHVPRFEIYRTKLLTALERAEDGDIEWVSAVRVESYHTVWFELHEDLLRLMGRERQE